MDKKEWACLLLANRKGNHVNVMGFKIVSNELKNHKSFFNLLAETREILSGFASLK